MVFKTKSAPCETYILTNQNQVHHHQAVKTTSECSRPRGYPLCLPLDAGCFINIQPFSWKLNSQHLKKKKKAKNESCEMFLWGSNEDSSPGNSPSGSSDTLSGEGETRAAWMWFYLRGRHDMKHTFWQRVAASHKKVAATHEEQISLLTILVVF